MMNTAKAILKNNEEKDILEGFPWVYANEVDHFDGKINYDAPTDGLHTFTGGWKYQIVTTFTFSGNLAKFVGMVTTDSTKGAWNTDEASSGKYTFTWKDGITEMKLPVGTGGDTAASFKFEYLI